MKKYLVLYCTADGFRAYQMEESEVHEFLEENNQRKYPLTLVDSLPRDLNDLFEKMIIFKAEVIIPEKVEVVTKYRLGKEE